jgi:hypothetical protein
MATKHSRICFITPVFLLYFLVAYSDPIIHVNQVAFDSRGAKIAVVENDAAFTGELDFSVADTSSLIVFTGKLGMEERVEEWRPGAYFYKADFSAFQQAGKYRLRLTINGKTWESEEFVIGSDALARLTIPSILQYYRKQRANTPAEIEADAHVQLWGSTQTVDMRGGWCDASGDVSKYFSHLAYANFMSPQQTPLVTWSLASVAESIPALLTELGVKDSIIDESLWGADYMMRALSEQGYFRMIIFSYFNKDPKARRVVGLLANSVTTADYQCAFREGGGMAIAALARISAWKKNGAYTSQQYIDGAKRAFAHLLINNTKYDDDGKENIIDDYCALMAAS